MIYATYGEQRSFPEYVDMIFKDLTLRDGCDADGMGYPVESSKELMGLMQDGYWPDFVDDDEIPQVLAEVADDYSINLGLAHFSQRRFKKLCGKIFSKYGEEAKAIQTCAELTIKYDLLAAEYDIEYKPDSD